MKAFGIYEPKARELAAMDWVNPEYIWRHVENGSRRGDSLGLVIFRMQSGDPAPLSEAEQRKEYYKELNRKYGVITGAEEDEEEEEDE